MNKPTEIKNLKVGAQDQVLKTRSMVVKIHKRQPESKRRICKSIEETIEHIVAECPILAERELFFSKIIKSVR